MFKDGRMYLLALLHCQIQRCQPKARRSSLQSRIEAERRSIPGSSPPMPLSCKSGICMPFMTITSDLINRLYNAIFVQIHCKKHCKFKSCFGKCTLTWFIAAMECTYKEGVVDCNKFLAVFLLGALSKFSDAIARNDVPYICPYKILRWHYDK